MHLQDNRLIDLHEISVWFQKWKIDSKDNPKVCMSFQCHEDLQSCILGFIELCKMVIKCSKHNFCDPWIGELGCC